MPTQPCEKKPANVTFTIAASLLSDEQSARLRHGIDEIDELGSQLIECIAAAGKALEEYLSGHALEERATRVLLEPLRKDANALVELLLRIHTRLLLSLPPLTPEQFDAGMELQLQDISEAPAKTQRAAERSEAERELEHLVSVAYAALAEDQQIIDATAQAWRHRKGTNGALTASEQSVLDATGTASKRSADAVARITAWRREQAKRGTP